MRRAVEGKLPAHIEPVRVLPRAIRGDDGLAGRNNGARCADMRAMRRKRLRGVPSGSMLSAKGDEGPMHIVRRDRRGDAVEIGSRHE